MMLDLGGAPHEPVGASRRDAARNGTPTAHHSARTAPAYSAWYANSTTTPTAAGTGLPPGGGAAAGSTRAAVLPALARYRRGGRSAELDGAADPAAAGLAIAGYCPDARR